MQGIVLKCEGDDLIRIELASEHDGDEACMACHLKESCELPKTRILEIKPSDVDLVLQVGDRVDVSMSPRNTILLSFSVYILPLICMIGMGVLGARYNQNISIVLSFAGLGIGLLFNVVLNKRLSLKRILTITRCL